MSTLYDKSYELIFGKPFQLTTSSFSIFETPEEKLVAIEDFFDTGNTNGVKLTAHDISFDISKTKKSSTNKSYIEVRNMSTSTVEYLSNQQGQKPAVILKAGFGGKNKEIFRGQLESYADRKEGQNRITKLLLTDGAENAREANSIRTYRKGTPVSTIVSQLLSDMGVPKAGGGVLLDPDNVVTKKAFYVSGRTGDNLDKIASSTLGALADWTITDMHSYWIPEGETVGIESVVPLSEDSGLIGSPVIKDDSSGKPTYTSSDTTKNLRSIKFKTLLNGALVPLGGVTLDSDKFKGTFKIVDVKHVGKLEGSKWFTEVVAEEVPEGS